MTGAEFRDRVITEFESTAAKKFDRGCVAHGHHPAAEASILREDCFKEMADEIYDLFFYYKGAEFQKRKALEGLYAALGDSHGWREHVMKAISLLETGKE